MDKYLRAFVCPLCRDGCLKYSAGIVPITYTCYIFVVSSPSAKNKDVSPQIMIICAKCQKTLPATDFAKKQQKKNQKGKPCMCLGCCAKMGSGKTAVKGEASSSGASVNEVVS